ncbi:MAG: 3'-5' exonuclease [Bacteroidales bacterium]|jgi:DNA polymerase-3 subunit epsilon|nr:3'-5' exonuclease [Bacteroidales bacterium]
MQLNLQRPIVFFDLETTGLIVGKDKIVEICLLKVFPDGREEVSTFIINPGIPIPTVVSEIHGIYDKDVADKSHFAELADTINAILEDSDLAGFNSNKFDIPFLAEEFHQCGKDLNMLNRKLVDIQNIFHKMEPRNLVAAYKFYCGKDLSGAHEAENDTRATYEILKAQIERYQDTVYEDKSGKTSIPIANDIHKLSLFSSDSRNVDMVGRIVFNEKDEEVFAFGKHNGKTVEQVLLEDRNYLDWIMRSDFHYSTKEVVKKINERLSLKNHFAKKV